MPWSRETPSPPLGWSSFRRRGRAAPPQDVEVLAVAQRRADPGIGELRRGGCGHEGEREHESGTVGHRRILLASGYARKAGGPAHHVAKPIEPFLLTFRALLFSGAIVERATVEPSVEAAERPGVGPDVHLGLGHSTGGRPGSGTDRAPRARRFPPRLSSRSHGKREASDSERAPM